MSRKTVSQIDRTFYGRSETEGKVMKKRKVIAIALAALMACASAACGSSYNSASSSAAKSEAVYETEEYEVADNDAPMAAYSEDEWEVTEEAAYDSSAESGDGSVYTAEQDSGEITLSNDKLVYTCNMEIETTEYAETVAAIREKIREYGAIIEYESESDSNRYWYYEDNRKTSGTMYLSWTIRVPVAKYDAFVSDAGTMGKLISKSQNVDNISRQYHSTEARIEALEKEEKRLNEMMDAAETIEEMIYIEERLTDVEYELNTNRTSLASMDVDVAYSTVNMNVREVLVYTSTPAPTVTFGQRVKEAFRDSWKGFTSFCEGLLIVIIHLLPFLFAALVIVLLILGINRIADKKHPERVTRRRAAKEAKRAAKASAKERKAAMKAAGKSGRPYQQNIPMQQPPQSPQKPTQGTVSSEADRPAEGK